MHLHEEFFTEDLAVRLRRDWEDAVLKWEAIPRSDWCAACLLLRPPILLFASDVRTADWRVMTDGARVRFLFAEPA